MKSPSDSPENGDALREKLIGLGERSLRKSYYPELQQRLAELERFKAFLDHSNDAIFLIEVPSAKIVDVNESSCRQLGWSREELLALSIFDVTALAGNAQAKRLVCELEGNGERALVETVLNKRDGIPIPAEITLDRMVFQEGTYAVAVARDIEKRKRAEEALAERARLAELGSEIGVALTKGGGLESTLQQCVESLVRYTEAAFGRIWIVNSGDPQLLVLKASAGMYRHTDGRHSRKRIGKLRIGMIALERKPYLTNAVIGDPAITDQEWAKEEGIVALAGYPLLVEDRLVGVAALFFKRPMTAAVLSAISSVVDEIAIGIQRLRAEEALGKSEKQYHTLAEVSPIGIFYTNAKGDFLYVNDRWIEITGYSRDEALNMDLAWGNNPEDRICAVEEWLEAACKEHPFKAEYYFQRRDGKMVWLYNQVMAEKDPRGEVVGYVGTITDITDRKRAEEELRESEERRLRLQAQLEFAAEVQSKLLPQEAPVVAGFEIAARCLPAYQVAGDFYDWQQLAPGLLTLTLGDVMGKGLAAAMLMATVRATLRAVTQEHKPAVALHLAEKALRQDLNSSDSFVTLFHAQLDLAGRSLTYVDCGHGLVFLRRAAGRVEELPTRGLPLGVFSDEGYQEGTVTFEDGDALVLYSDGLIDALPELALDNRALAGQLDGSASAREMVDRLVALVPLEVPLPDDMTVLVVRCQEENQLPAA
ncbi:MAG TPA: PAS domain S-box protein [Desulfuromonadales bacterium]